MNHNIKQCGVTPHISTRAKSFEKILKKEILAKTIEKNIEKRLILVKLLKKKYWKK